jgi:hypothetical protein
MTRAEVKNSEGHPHRRVDPQTLVSYTEPRMSETDRRAQVFALMARYNQLGRLLPEPDDLENGDAAAVSEAKVILAEMNETRAEIDALLGAQ